MADFGLLEYWEKTVVAPVTRLRDIYETTGRGRKNRVRKGKRGATFSSPCLTCPATVTPAVSSSPCSWLEGC